MVAPSARRTLTHAGQGRRGGVFEDQAQWSGKREVEKEGSVLRTPSSQPNP